MIDQSEDRSRTIIIEDELVKNYHIKLTMVLCLIYYGKDAFDMTYILR